MNRTFLTEDERTRIGLTTVPLKSRNWSKERIRKAIIDKGFPSVAAFERAVGVPQGYVNQSYNRRFPSIEKIIASFLDVHISEIWPDRYLQNGKPIHYHYRVQEMSDEDLAKLNKATLHPEPVKVVSLPKGIKLDV